MSGRSKLEDDLAFAMKAVGLPAPVRQFRPMWCCQHLTKVHGARYLEKPVYDFEYVCWECRVDGREDWVHPEKKGRRWAVDFAWPDRRLIVEVEGGVYTQGRHTRASGFIKDVEKYNAITLAGWTLLRFTRREVNSGEALNQIERALKEAS